MLVERVLSQHTVVSSPSKWLSTVPTRECVGREARVHQAEVGLVENVVEVMVVVVDLRWGELSLVNDVLRRQRADVESFRECARDGCGQLGTVTVPVLSTYMVCVACFRSIYN